MSRMLNRSTATFSELKHKELYSACSGEFISDLGSEGVKTRYKLCSYVLRVQVRQLEPFFITKQAVQCSHKATALLIHFHRELEVAEQYCSTEMAPALCCCAVCFRHSD